MGFARALNAGQQARLSLEPALSGVLSWNAHAGAGRISVRLLRGDIPDGEWLDLFEWNDAGRRSFSPQRDGVRVQTDVLRSDAPFDGIEALIEGGDFAMVAFATPVAPRVSLPYAREALILDVAPRSQYVVEGERGWCSPTCLAMLHAYHGIDLPTVQTAAAVFDSAYDGTGNWSFNVAYSGNLGLRAAAVYLDGLERAQRLIERGLPIAISYRWEDRELPGAPLDRSDGHLVVLTGFTANGDCAVNDPAHPHLRVVYPRAAVETIWQRSGGVAYVVAPVGIDFDDVLTT
ncbi:MAG TPA: C39 family peptidase [Candidatus Baltobacteraceae bacterium]